MKPSDRIKRIMLQMSQESGYDEFHHKIGAIWQYLDEEWEKNQRTKTAEVPPHQLTTN